MKSDYQLLQVGIRLIKLIRLVKLVRNFKF